MVLSEDEEAQMAYHMSTTDETMRFYDVDELQELIQSDADCRSPAKDHYNNPGGYHHNSGGNY